MKDSKDTKEAQELYDFLERCGSLVATACPHLNKRAQGALVVGLFEKGLESKKIRRAVTAFDREMEYTRHKKLPPTSGKT